MSADGTTFDLISVLHKRLNWPQPGLPWEALIASDQLRGSETVFQLWEISQPPAYLCEEEAVGIYREQRISHVQS